MALVMLYVWPLNSIVAKKGHNELQAAVADAASAVSSSCWC